MDGRRKTLVVRVGSACIVMNMKFRIVTQSARAGDLFTFNPDADRELPVTPNLFLNVQKADIQHETPASSMCVHGPTPNNTPAAGCVLSMPAPTLLSQAVNELKGVSIC